jgi:hypothetical protein
MSSWNLHCATCSFCSEINDCQGLFPLGCCDHSTLMERWRYPFTFWLQELEMLRFLLSLNSLCIHNTGLHEWTLFSVSPFFLGFNRTRIQCKLYVLGCLCMRLVNCEQAVCIFLHFWTTLLHVQIWSNEDHDTQ